MISTIILAILGLLFLANLIVLVRISNNPMYNVMDTYNRRFDYEPYEHRLHNIDERLNHLETKFNYHIQSTDELKPKA